jgi:hypothetical protein
VVIRKFQSLPSDRKQILKAAMQHPCSWCEAEFRTDIGDRNTGKSHGVCRRHATDVYKQMGKLPPANFGNGSFDLASLSPDERKLLGLLFATIKRRQKEKGTF